MKFARMVVCLSLLASLQTRVALAQSRSQDSQRPLKSASSGAGCPEAPREDALVATCVPPSFVEDAEARETAQPPAKIALQLPSGTPIRIALDQRVRVGHPGELVHGKVVESVYAFDQPVIPAGSVATGRVIKVTPASAPKRVLAYANGNFSPFRDYQVTFDTLTLADGKQLAIKTSVSAGTAEVVHLVSNPDKNSADKDKKGAAGRATDKAKDEAHSKIQEAKDQAHESWNEITAPGKMQRIKQYALAQSPYRRQYLEPGTRFVADLDAPLDFGEVNRTGEQLAAVGTEPVPDSTLKARLVAEVSSATASRGTPVTAVLTEPLYSPTHQLILPANSRLVGEVLQAKPAQKLHRNGELRVMFERIETPEDAVQAVSQVRRTEERAQLPAHSQAMTGNLEGLEVDRNSNIKLDEEGGARTTDNKSRYLSTGLAVLLAAAASHGEVEHGTTETAGPGVRTAAGGSGFRLTGALLSLVAKSTPVSATIGAYGASASIYSNFLSRGRDVVLPKDTPLEIGFGAPHGANAQTKAADTAQPNAAKPNATKAGAEQPSTTNPNPAEPDTAKPDGQPDSTKPDASKPDSPKLQ